jgi:DNA-directed RNA polymerase specialized sigma24 family protein
MAEPGTEVRDLLRALVALQAENRERQVAKDPSAQKTEVILASCGLPAHEIALMLGKQPDAVRKTLSRARKRGGTAGGVSDGGE